MSENKGFWAFLTSLPGILASLATIAASVITLVALFRGPGTPADDPGIVQPTEPGSIIKYNELNSKWGDPDFADSLLFAEYKDLHPDKYETAWNLEQKNTIIKRIEFLKESISRFKDLKNDDSSADLTIAQKLDGWLNYIKRERTDRAKHDYATKRIEFYQEQIRDWASIKEEIHNFLVCRKVAEKEPYGENTEFYYSPPGAVADTVWVWASINAPRKETLKLEWRDAKSGQTLAEREMMVEGNTTRRGYRIGRSRTFTAGEYEARLYNSQRQLIGRRSFEVIETQTTEEN